MATKRPLPATTDKPPRGFWYESRPSPLRPFLLRWRDSEGKRVSSTFATASDRAKAAKSLFAKRQQFSRAILDFDPLEWERWTEFRRLTGGADPLEVAQHWLRRDSVPERETKTIAEAWADYERLRQSERAISDDSWRHLRLHIGQRFVSEFGGVQLGKLTAPQIRTWLAGLTSWRGGGPVGALTRRHHRKDLAVFLGRCVREGWLDRNPCDLVEVPGDDSGEVTVIPVDDAVRYFAANAGRPFLVRLALEAFGGLRCSTAGRIGWENINFAERGIEMPGAIHKSGKRKFRQGQPANLWSWLELASDPQHEAWSMTHRQYAEEKSRGAVRAGVVIPRNGWRHSFASYLLAQTKSLPSVGYLMQHSSTKVTQIYEGVARERDAAVYFGIVP